MIPSLGGRVELATGGINKNTADTGFDLADAGESRAGDRAGVRHRSVRIDSEEQLVVLAIGERRRAGIGVSRHKVIDDLHAHAGGSRQPSAIATHAVGNVDHGVKAGAECVRQPAGLGDARLEGQVPTGRKRTADATGDVQVIAGLGTSAGHGPTRRVRVSADGDRDHGGAVTFGQQRDITANQRAAEVRCPVGHAVKQRLSDRLVKG